MTMYRIITLSMALPACWSSERRSTGTSNPTPKSLSSGGTGAQPSAVPLPDQHPPAAAQILSKSSPTLLVKSCEPCEFEASADLKFQVRFKPSGDRGVGQVDIQPVQPMATGAKAPSTQSFEIEDGWSPSGEFMLHAVDVNFDGILDLAFGPILGTPNLTLEYWTVDAKQAKLDELGKFTNLTADASKKEIHTYEKGGHAGLLNESKTYRWQDGKLVPVSANSQSLAPNGTDYVKTTRRFENGHVVEQKKQSVKAP